MTIYDYAGPVAGATLGYIMGNTRGAIAGYKLARNFVKRMPATRRHSIAGPYPTPSRSRRGSTMSVSSVGSNPFARRGSVASSSSTARRMSLGTRSTVSVAGSTSASGYRGVRGNAAAVKKKRTKGVSWQRRKRVKVTRKFKKKVKEAMMEEHLQGTYLKVTYNRILAPGNFDQQAAVDMGVSFGNLQYNNAADVLFNGRTPAEFVGPLSNEWENPLIRKDIILNSWVSYELKNMSQRTWTVKGYVCKPKSVTTDESPNGALGDWTSGMVVEAGNGINPSSNTPNTLYSDPRDCAQFNQFWKCELTTIVLEPGQSHTMFVQGPNDFVLDYKKLYAKHHLSSTGVWQLFGKYSRHVFFVGYCDLVTSESASAGRYPSTGVGSGGIVVERKEMYRLKCPESAGFKFAGTGVGTSQQLDMKKPTKIIKIFGSAIVGAVQDVLEENPITVINPAD